MPVAYFPRPEGLKVSEAAELLGVFMRDSRIRAIEISEYASLRDLDRSYVDKLAKLFTDGLRP